MRASMRSAICKINASAAFASSCAIAAMKLVQAVSLSLAGSCKPTFTPGEDDMFGSLDRK